MLDAVFKPFIQTIKTNQCSSVNIEGPRGENEGPQKLQLLSTWKGHEGSVWALTVLSDGTVVSGSYDKTLRRWDPSTGECLGVWEGHTSTVLALTVLPDNR